LCVSAKSRWIVLAILLITLLLFRSARRWVYCGGIDLGV